MSDLPPNALLRKQWPEACRLRVSVYEDPGTGRFFIAMRSNATVAASVAEINGAPAVSYEEAAAAAEDFYQALKATTPAALARALLEPSRMH